MVEVVKFESAQSKFVHEWSRGFHENNLDTIVKPLHKDFRYALYPRSLGAPEQNREQFTECMKQMVGAGFVCYDVSDIGCHSNDLRLNPFYSPSTIPSWRFRARSSFMSVP